MLIGCCTAEANLKLYSKSDYELQILSAIYGDDTLKQAMRIVDGKSAS